MLSARSTGYRVVFALLTLAAIGDQKRSSRVELVRGAATLNLTTTFVVYGLLLSGHAADPSARA